MIVLLIIIIILLVNNLRKSYTISKLHQFLLKNCKKSFYDTISILGC